MSQNTISFWIRLVISHTYSSGTDADCGSVKVNAYEVRKIDTSLQKELCSPAGGKSRYIVLSNDLCILSTRCHPLVYGLLFNQPFGGC